LLRWEVPPGSPAHLAVSVDELAHVTGRQTLLILSDCARSPELLERVSDARKHGARIMAMHRGDEDLNDLSHEVLSVDPLRDDRDFDLTQHLVTDVAPLELPARRKRVRRLIGN
jgi:DNA-binding MurR/RpiR family transcriptional regulator